jgi:hypothetical protein
MLAFGNVNVFWAPDRGIVRAFSADPLTHGAWRTRDQRFHEAKKLMEQVSVNELASRVYATPLLLNSNED